MMKLQYYGGTCFQFYNEDNSVLINPEFTNNKFNFKDLSQIKSKIIVLTRYDYKSINDVVAIARNNDSYIIASYAIINKLRSFGLNNEKLFPVVVGQRLIVDNVYFHFVYSIADSNLNGSLAMGVIVKLEDIKVYHDGSTSYYSDLKLIKNEKIDYALISASNFGPKNIEELKMTVTDINSNFFVPMNYRESEIEDFESLKNEILNNKFISSVPVILFPNSGIIIKK